MTDWPGGPSRAIPAGRLRVGSPCVCGSVPQACKRQYPVSTPAYKRQYPRQYPSCDGQTLPGPGAQASVTRQYPDAQASVSRQYPSWRWLGTEALAHGSAARQCPSAEG